VPEWTIKALLEWVDPYLKEKGVDAPRLCAELLICHVLKKERIQLYTEFDHIVPSAQLASLRSLVKRASDNEPVAYLVGKTEFYSLEMEVSPACLIPRPETELLVQHGIEILRERSGTPRVLDLCTGSGCVAVAIAKNVPEALVAATDVSAKALEVAGRNVARHGLDSRVQLREGNLFAPVDQAQDAGGFDLIVSNPPYVTDAEMSALDPNVREYEPSLALQAGPRGLDILEPLVAQAADFLTGQGVLMLEIGYRQGPDVSALLEAAERFKPARTIPDHQGHDRIIIAERSC
jgi:release factor glutamine methyltransferase